MKRLTTKLLESDDSLKLKNLLEFVRSKVILVGSRGRGDHRDDSDLDLHIPDMMDTDKTFDEICQYLTDNHILHDSDKFDIGYIGVPEQPGVPVSIDFGFWGNTPPDTRVSRHFGVDLMAAIERDSVNA